MKLKSIKTIEPQLSNCISVDSTDKLFAIGENNENLLLTHNSVSQQNIVFSCLLRPDNWVILGIDLKRVELSRFRKYGMNVATDIDTALEYLRFGQAVMMKRYEDMEKIGLTNFMDMPGKNQALMIMIDEVGELLSPTGVKTDEGKAEDELKGEAQMIIGSIARLGRAAGVHLIIATQRPDAKIIAGETRANFGVRIGCGTLNSTSSSMILESNIGTKIRSNPRGGMYIQIYGKGNMGQGFFAPNEWLDEYIKTHGEIKKSDGATSSIGEVPESQGPKEKKADALDDWDEDMDILTS